METYVTYNNIEFIVTVEDYNYRSAERATTTYPGCDAEVEVIAGSVELDGEVFEPTDEESAIIALVTSNNAALFAQIYAECADSIDTKLFEHIHNNN